jgi:citrate lyase subunit beta/citryl-CoA lyase
MLDDVAAWLYVPGIRPELFSKAAAAADGIVIDLEDAVRPSMRVEARHQVAAFFERQRVDVPVLVRINPVGSSDINKDLELLEPLVRRGQIDGIRLSKIDRVDQVEWMASATREWSESPILICQLESARAVRNAFEIADAEGVHSIMLGEGDLRADLNLPLGTAGDPGLLFARQTVVVASRAAGLPSPVGSAFTNVEDDTALRVTSMELRAFGFFGRSCIHPRQVAVVRAAFASSEQERAAAEQIVVRASEAADEESSAAVTANGAFVDPAIVKHAQSVLRRVHSHGRGNMPGGLWR